MIPFTRGPVTFQHPAGWEVSVEDDGGAWAVTAQSDATAFFVVSLRPEVEDAGQLADDTLAALAAEYTELDIEPVVASLGGWPSLGHDIDFIAIDTPITCLTRCLNTSDGPVLLLAQVSDLDRAANEPILRAMLDSVRIEDEE